MATNTYVALDKITVGTAVSSVTFSSINQGYTDLVIVGNVGGSTAGSSYYFQFNGDTTSNYSFTYLTGSGASAFSGRASGSTNGAMGYYSALNTSLESVNIMQIMNYSNATTFKTVLSRANRASAGTDPGAEASVSLWRKTPEAITSIKLFPGAGNFIVGSTFSLYGIAAASVGAKATGGTIYSDSSYYYHVFDSTSTFTPTQSLTVDALLVAGGGGAGINSGGGAGGVLLASSQSLTSGTAYTATVGGGGTGGSGNPIAGATNGQNSTFNSNSAIGGGYGGIESGTRAGNAGGSGGGEGAAGTGGGGAATSGQGNAGGTSGGFSGNFPGGGGGGAGAVGSNATSGTVAGNGGNGTTTYNSWSLATGFGQNVSGTYYFAGGGGGSLFTISGGTPGTGGYGGGGAGNGASPGIAGTANTGGGGGATNSRGTGGQGGSGVVIVRYLKA
jgi:hypothetical protein